MNRIKENKFLRACISRLFEREKMQAIEKYISEIESKLPQICSASDLIRLELASRPTLFRMRQSGTGPAFFRIHRKKFQYLKGDVLAWIRNNYNSGDKNDSAD